MSYVAHQPDTGAVTLEDFDPQSGSLIERALFNNRLLIVLFCLLATLGLGYQAMGLTLNAAFEKMIPTRHEYIANFLENRAQLSGAGNTLRIAVETKKGNIFAADYLEVVRKINADVNRVLADPEVVAQLATFGFDGAAGTPEQFAEEIRADAKKYGELVRRTGATAD